MEPDLDNTLYRADLSRFPFHCFHCKAEIIFNGPGLIGTVLDDRNSTKDYKIFNLEANMVCPECHKKIDAVLVPKEYLSLWKGKVLKFKEMEKEMSDKVMLRSLICRFCETVEIQGRPKGATRHTDGYLLDTGVMTCLKCGERSRKVSPYSKLWEDRVDETIKEVNQIMDQQVSRLDTTFKIAAFIFVWVAAALAAYGLSFVPWTLILWKLWELTKLMTYAFTRWWTLTGLAVTLFIFYHWHRQAIRDFYDYHSNIWGARSRYRKLKQKKHTLEDEEVKSFVNEVNGKEKNFSEVLDEIKEVDQKVPEDHIPF